MSGLNKHEILGATDSQVVSVEVPEWGGGVFIRVMSVGERDEYENEWLKTKDRGGMPNFRTKFLARTICTAAGERVFTDADIPELAKKSATVMNRLWQKAMEINALKESDVEALAGN